MQADDPNNHLTQSRQTTAPSSDASKREIIITVLMQTFRAKQERRLNHTHPRAPAAITIPEASGDLSSSALWRPSRGAGSEKPNIKGQFDIQRLFNATRPFGESCESVNLYLERRWRSNPTHFRAIKFFKKKKKKMCAAISAGQWASSV